jgi:hypothetical protein
MLFGQNPLDVLAAHPEDLAILDDVLERAQKLWVERVQAVAKLIGYEVASRLVG